MRAFDSSSALRREGRVSEVSSRFRFLLRQEGIVLAVTLLLALILVVSLPGFRTFDNLIALVRNISILGILGVGLAIVVVGRGIDLSIAATMAISAAWTIKLCAMGMPEIAAIGCGILLVVAVGFVNGYLVAFAEIPPIFVTLATALVIYGFGQFILIRTLVVNLPETATIMPALGQGRLFGIPAQLFILAAAAAAGHAFLSKTRWGRFTYAQGDNQEAARLSGIKVRPLIILQYILAGLIAFAGGVMLAGGNPTFSIRVADGGILFDAILVVVLGGVSLGGGSGSIFSVLAGTLLLGTILNGMTIMDLTQQVQDLVKGGVLLTAIIVDAALHPRDEQTARQSDI